MSVIVKGYDAVLPVTLKKNKETFPIDSGAVIKAVIVDVDHTEKLSQEVTIDKNAEGTDLTNSLIIVQFTEAQTAAITTTGNALLEISVDDEDRLPQHQLRGRSGDEDPAEEPQRLRGRKVPGEPHLPEGRHGGHEPLQDLPQCPGVQCLRPRHQAGYSGQWSACRESRPETGRRDSGRRPGDCVRSRGRRDTGSARLFRAGLEREGCPGPARRCPDKDPRLHPHARGG